MINSETRKDKFFPMNQEEFKTSVVFALRNGDRQIAYCKKENDVIYGGMALTLEDALVWCEKFYRENPNCELSIGDYSEGVTIWDTQSILHELGIISDKEYDEYIDSLELDE